MAQQEYIIRGESMELNKDESLTQFIYDGLVLNSNKNRTSLIEFETGKKYTALNILSQSVQISEWLRKIGIENGVVSICSENRAEFGPALYGALFLGLTVAPMSSMYTLPEIQNAVNIAKPRAIFCSKGTLPKILKIKGKNKFITHIVCFDFIDPKTKNDVYFFGNFTNKNLTITEVTKFKPVKIKDIKNHIATIMMSSGTSGPFKGGILTHKNYMAYIQSQRFFGRGLYTEDIMEFIKSLSTTSFTHAMGAVSLTSLVPLGATVVILGKFSIETFLQCIQKYQITTTALPPSVLSLLTKYPNLDKYDLSSLMVIGIGSAPLGKELQEKAAQIFPDIRIVQAYGMTESTLGCISNVSPTENIKFGSVGTVSQGVEAKVINDEGKTLGPYCEGELCFRGALIMKGYLDNKTATDEAIDKEGWLHSGDIGYYDDENYFFIVDRKKELIKYKGYQVSPSEIEAIILKHEGVLDCGVVGIPDDEATELPLALVVKRPGSNINEREIIDFVAKQVSPVKRLRGGVKFVEQIPRNNNQKIVRRQLKEMAIKKIKAKL